MKRISFVSGIIILLLLQYPTSAFSFSLANDWSDLINPNGPWSYNEGNNPLQNNIANWPGGEFGVTQAAWAVGNEAGELIPGWMKSVIDPNINGTHGPYDWQVGDVVVHSTDEGNGPDYGLANVTWTSPLSGLFDINGGLWMGRDIGRSNNWSLFLNNTLLTSGQLFTGDIYSRSNPNSFFFENVNIQSGDILRLDIYRTSIGGDFVGVNFDINQVNQVIPEPTTFLLVGSGLCGAFLRKRRYIKKS